MCIPYCITYALHNALRNLIAYLTAPPWGPHREAPVSPQGGGPWGYRLTHIMQRGGRNESRPQCQFEVAQDDHFKIGFLAKFCVIEGIAKLYIYIHSTRSFIMSAGITPGGIKSGQFKNENLVYT